MYFKEFNVNLLILMLDIMNIKYVSFDEILNENFFMSEYLKTVKLYNIQQLYFLTKQLINLVKYQHDWTPTFVE